MAPQRPAVIMLPHSLFLILPFLSSTLAHMEMTNPSPLRDPHSNRNEPKDYNMMAPLRPDGSDFPCKGYQLNTPLTPVATYHAGQTYNITLGGSASHGGGSCQISMSCDMGSPFKVIQSIMGGCPLESSYGFTVPQNLPTSTCLLAWTWFNKIGNREMYMNCAVVNVVGADDSSSDSTDSNSRTQKNRATSATNAAAIAQSKLNVLPDLYVANLKGINSCMTKESVDPVFNDPGTSVSYGDGVRPGQRSTGSNYCTGLGRQSAGNSNPASSGGGYGNSGDSGGSSSWSGNSGQWSDPGSSSSSSGGEDGGGNNGQWTGGSSDKSCLSDGQWHPNGCGSDSSSSNSKSNSNNNNSNGNSNSNGGSNSNNKSSSNSNSNSDSSGQSSSSNNRVSSSSASDESSPNPQVEAQLDAYLKSLGSNSDSSSKGNSNGNSKASSSSSSSSSSDHRNNDKYNSKNKNTPSSSSKTYSNKKDSSDHNYKSGEFYNLNSPAYNPSAKYSDTAKNAQDDTYVRAKQGKPIEVAKVPGVSVISQATSSTIPIILPVASSAAAVSVAPAVVPSGSQAPQAQRPSKISTSLKWSTSTNVVWKSATSSAPAKSSAVPSVPSADKPLGFHPGSPKEPVFAIPTPLAPQPFINSTSKSRNFSTTLSTLKTMSSIYVAPVPTRHSAVDSCTGQPVQYVTGDPNALLPCEPGTFLCKSADEFWTCGQFNATRGWTYGGLRLVTKGMECRPSLSAKSIKEKRSFVETRTAKTLQAVDAKLDIVSKAFDEIANSFDMSTKTSAIGREGLELVKRSIVAPDATIVESTLLNMTEKIESLDATINRLLNPYDSALKTLGRSLASWFPFGDIWIQTHCTNTEENTSLLSVSNKINTLLEKAEQLKKKITRDGQLKKRNRDLWGLISYDVKKPHRHEQDTLPLLKSITTNIDRLDVLAKDIMNSRHLDYETSDFAADNDDVVPYSSAQNVLDKRQYPTSDVAETKRMMQRQEGEAQALAGPAIALGPMDKSTSPKPVIVSVKRELNNTISDSTANPSVKPSAKPSGKLSSPSSKMPSSTKQLQPSQTRQPHHLDTGTPGPRPAHIPAAGDGTDFDFEALFPDLKPSDAEIDESEGLGTFRNDADSAKDPLSSGLVDKNGKTISTSLKVLVNPLRPTESVMSSSSSASTAKATKSAATTSLTKTLSRVLPTISSPGRNESTSAKHTWHDGVLFLDSTTVSSPPVPTPPTLSFKTPESLSPHVMGHGPVVLPGSSLNWPSGPFFGNVAAKSTSASASTPTIPNASSVDKKAPKVSTTRTVASSTPASVTSPIGSTSLLWPPPLPGVTGLWPSPLPSVTAVAGDGRNPANKVENVKTTLDQKTPQQRNMCPGWYRNDLYVGKGT